MLEKDLYPSKHYKRMNQKRMKDNAMVFREKFDESKAYLEIINGYDWSCDNVCELAEVLYNLNKKIGEMVEDQEESFKDYYQFN